MTESLKITKTDIRVMCFVVSIAIVQLFGIDLYIPSLPNMLHSLHASQTVAQLSVAFYTLGAAISVLLAGPLSDHTGRKPIILRGLIGLLVGGLICLFAENGMMLLLGRIVQGVGAGFCLGANRAVITDIFSAKKLAYIGSYFGAVVALSPILAPLAGGYLEHYFNWRASFFVLSVCYVVLLLAYFCFFKETITEKIPGKLSPSFVFKRYVYLLSQSQFRTFALCFGLMVGVSIAYATAAPFIFQKTLHLTPVAFGWLGIYLGIGNILGKLLVPSMVRRFDLTTILHAGLVIIFVSGLSFFLLDVFGLLHLILAVAVLTIAFFGQACGGLAFTLSVSPYRHMGGAANALLSFAQMGISFLISALLSFSSACVQEGIALSGAFMSIALIAMALCFFHRQISQS